MPEEVIPVDARTVPSAERPAPSFDGDGLVGAVGLTPVLRMMENLPFRDAVNLLSTNRAYLDNFELWRGLANIYQIPIPQDVKTAAGVRDVLKITVTRMMVEFRGELQHLTRETSTPELITSFLERAQRYSFLWSALVDRMIKLYGQEMKYHSEDVYSGTNIFRGVSQSLRRAYFEAIANRKNPDGTPSFGASLAQNQLNRAAYDGALGFTHDYGTPTSAYDYLVKVAARTNPNGKPEFEAEDAQNQLNRAAYDGALGFTHDRDTPTSAYDYLVKVAARTNPDGTTGPGAEDAKFWLERVKWPK
jgi:hypothetical protein